VRTVYDLTEIDIGSNLVKRLMRRIEAMREVFEPAKQGGRMPSFSVQ
jgi:hypothetical protein